MGNKLFSEISPLTYKIAVNKGIIVRRINWLVNRNKYASEQSSEILSVRVYKHKSLIRRRLGNVDMVLQENKAINLKLAAPQVNGIIIKPNQIFSFWKLVGKCTEDKGFKEGLVIRGGKVDKGIGGGMCQFTNLIHWMVLHSPLDITEYHHHNNIDMFPDYGRKIPFGTGTSIMYNYLDYQFVNNTDKTFQLITYTTDEFLCGELRCDEELDYSYHVEEVNACFVEEEDGFYRENEIFRITVDKRTGKHIRKECMTINHSKVLYDRSFIPEDKIKRGKYVN